MDSSLVSSLRCGTGLGIPASLGCEVVGQCRSPLERDANAVPSGNLFRPERYLDRTSLVAAAEGSAIELSSHVLSRPTGPLGTLPKSGEAASA